VPLKPWSCRASISANPHPLKPLFPADRYLFPKKKRHKSDWDMKYLLSKRRLRLKRGNGDADVSFKRTVKKALNPLKGWLAGDTLALMMQSHQLMGRMASWEVRSRRVLSTLRDAEFKVSSQWGEDGIIDWLIERAQIPPIAQSFIEFGVENYRESNTRFLMQNRDWRGLIMDGNADVVAAVDEDSLRWKHDITVLPAFITRENINELISSAGFHGDIGLLSIDIDGNDYWVWEAIHVVRPIICICEYNAVFGDAYPISTPYNPSFNRTKAHHSNLYFGASIAALRSLAAQKSYRFAGTNAAANNAFFVREDYAEKFVDSSIQRIQALPSLIRESRDESGQLSYVGGIERLKLISNLPVVNVVTGETIRLDALESVYSKEWLEIMMGSTAE
jgi:hypothetical protein